MALRFNVNSDKNQLSIIIEY